MPSGKMKMAYKAEMTPAKSAPVMSKEDKKEKSVNFSISIQKKDIDGKMVTSHTLSYWSGKDGKDIKKEYTNKEDFIKHCVEPTIDKFSEEIS